MFEINNEEAILDEGQSGDNNDGVAIIDTYDTDAMKKFALTEAAKAKHWRTKFQKLESTLKSDTPATTKPITQAETPASPVAKASSFDELAEIHSVMRNLADDELQDLRSSAAELGVDPVKYIKSKAGQALLKEFRTTKKTTETTPSPSNKVATFNGKPIDSILLDDKSSPADKQRAFVEKLRGTKGFNQNI